MKHAQIDPQMCTHVNKLIHQYKAYFQHVALRMNLSIVGDHFETIFFNISVICNQVALWELMNVTGQT